MAKKKTVIIRADASVKTGTGHVMRCLALAQAMSGAGTDVVFAMYECPEALTKYIKKEAMSVHKVKSKPGTLKDAGEIAKLAARKKATWIVVDGYIFTDKYQDEIKKSGLRLLFVDDYGHCLDYSCDIVLNQNLYAGTHLYPETAAFTRLLLGTQYAMLRRDFLPYVHWKRDIPEKATKLLVTLGGSDPDNTTLKIIRTLKSSRLGLQVKAVVGGANPHIKSLEKEIAKSPNLQILKNVPNMPELMAWADMVITSGGSTCWETCFMGIPNIIIYCADNQKPIAMSLDAIGAAVNLGHNKEATEKDIVSALKRLAGDKEGRNIMSEKGKVIVDGRGTERVVYSMYAPCLREATKDDCRFVWELSNSKEVREVSFSQHTIPWEKHKDWYDRMMKDKDSYFLIAESCDGRPAGQVRFRINGRDATVSTSLAPDFRGKGYGGMLIAQGSEALFRTTKVDTIHAYIKPENTGSVRSFVRGGYCQVDLDSFAIERNSLHLIMKRTER